MLPVVSRLAPEKPGVKDHWVAELRARGMTREQVDKLAEIPESELGCSMHELLELLDAGCSPDVAFDIAS